VGFDFSVYDAVLLDLDGTLYHEEHALRGAPELVDRLIREGRRFACLSNSTLGPARLTKRLSRMGIAMPESAIYTAAAAACDYVRATFKHRASVFNLATEDIHDLLEGEVHWASSISDPCNVVICGAPANVFATEERQRTAMLHLRHGATLVGICADRVYPSPRGLELGCGALASMLAYAANVTPIYTGKPEALFFHELCERLGVQPSRCILIGDNLESDIAGAKAVGMKTMLVLTGVTHEADVPRIPPHLKPDLIIPNLAELTC
jgi:HAD superfamily hydrolase (TIGR01450 family)